MPRLLPSPLLSPSSVIPVAAASSPLQNLQVGILVHDPDGRILLHNRAACDLLGVAGDQLLGSTGFGLGTTLVHADRTPWAESASPLAQVIRGGQPVYGIVLGVQHPGPAPPRWLQVDVEPQPAADSRGVQVISTFRPVAAPDVAPPSLIDTVPSLRALLDGATDGIIATDSTARILFCNPAAQMIFGYQSDDLRGQAVTKLIPDWDRAVRAYSGRGGGTGVQGGTPPAVSPVVELAGRCKDGTEFLLDLAVATWEMAGARYYSGSIRDTTERHQLEARLLESEASYRLLFDNNPQAVAIYDTETLRFLEVNAAGVNLYGYSRDEFLALTIADLRLPADRLRLQQLVAAPRRTLEFSGIGQHQFKDGSIHWMNVTSHAMSFTGRPARFVVALDVTEHIEAEQALQASEARYWQFVESSPTAFVVHDAATILYANVAALHMLGADRADELFGRPLNDIIHPASREQAQQRIEQVTQTGIPVPPDEHRLVRIDGQERTAEISSSPIVFQGRPAIQTIGRDITERQQQERALRESELRYRKLIETSPDVVLALDLTGRIRFGNQQAVLLYGVAQRDDLIGADAWSFVAPASAATVQAALQTALEHDVIYAVEYILIPRTGDPFPVEFSAALLRDAAGLPEAFLVVKRNISERKQSEQALRDSENLYRRLIETSPDAILLTDPLGTILLANERAARLYGFDIAATLVGHNTMDFLLPEDRATAAAQVQDVEANFKGEEQRATLLRRDGSRFPASICVSVVRDVAGQTTALLGISRDITAQLATEAMLQAYGDQQAVIAALAHQALGDGELSALFQMAVNTGAQALGVEYGAVLAYRSADESFQLCAAIGWDDNQTPAVITDRSSQATYTLQAGGPIVVVDQAGETRFGPSFAGDVGIASGLSVPIPGGSPPFGVLELHTIHRRGFSPSDIVFLESMATLLGTAVARRAAEATRLELANSLRMLLESVGAGIYGLDRHARCTFMNAAGARLLGYAPEELLGQVLHPLIHYRRADGSPYPAEECPIYRAARSGEGCRVTDEVLWRRDGTPLPVDYSVAPVIEAGKVMGSVVIFEDVTARRQSAEIERARVVAEAANRAKSEFLSRMSHELRTPLNAILGFAQILEMTDPTPDQTDSLGYILRAGRHLLELVNEVLDLTRVESGHLDLEITLVPLRDILQESLDLVRPLAAARQIRLTLDVAVQVPTAVQADRQRLLQVLLNLLANAVKYNRVGGAVNLTAELVAPNSVHIEVRDTGPGLTPAQISRLFTPFERLNAAQTAVEGSGLGLALAQHLVQAMGGTIGITSVYGEGSVFWVNLGGGETLPRVLPPGESPDLPVADPPAPLRTVLYIEDNLSNLRLVERILDRRPHIRLLAAMQGQIGLDLAHDQHPDLILLDLQLPDLSGLVVLDRLRAHPATAATPVVVVSADATPSQMERLRRGGAEIYLTKPLDVQQFLQVIDTLLPSAG